MLELRPKAAIKVELDGLLHVQGRKHQSPYYDGRITDDFQMGREIYRGL
jgi:hypothetical protein